MTTTAQRPLTAFWWRNPGFINIGDEVNASILSYASGREVQRAGPWRADIIAIGSILDTPMIANVFPARRKPLHVWGSGAMDASAIPWESSLVVSALRGPQTRALLAAPPADLALGDPGLLAPRVWRTRFHKKYRWGIVPHHTQLKAPWVRQFLEETPRAVLVNVCDPDMQQTFDTLAACERIVSSSLHGLIFADAWRIPNYLLEAGRLHRGGQRKFPDYFAGVGRPEPRTHAPADLAALAASEPAEDEFGYHAGIDAIADRLEAAFPDALKQAQA